MITSVREGLTENLTILSTLDATFIDYTVKHVRLKV